jgi:hypothetical protein
MIVTTLVAMVNDFPMILVFERILLIMMGILDFEDEGVIVTDYGFRIKLGFNGNYSKYSQNHYVSRRQHVPTYLKLLRVASQTQMVLMQEPKES